MDRVLSSRRARAQIFHPKALHVGHVAASFALREPPKRIKEAGRRERERDQQHKRSFTNKSGGGVRKRMREQQQVAAGVRPQLGMPGAGPTWDGKKRKIASFNADARTGLSAI